MNQEQRKYLMLLSEKFPTRQAVCTEIINLAAIMNLPKGTEHFMSDIHGEYEAFLHIMNNCSGVIREKIEMIFEGKLTPPEQRDLRTLIYYPKEKLKLLHEEGRANVLGHCTRLIHDKDIFLLQNCLGRQIILYPNRHGISAFPIPSERQKLFFRDNRNAKLPRFLILG